MQAGAGPSQASSTLASFVLNQYRSALLALYSHYAGTTGAGSSALSLSGWLAFLEAFDVCPGYLSTDKVEEVFEDAGRSVGRTPRRAATSDG